ncbi:unnamed protein product [Ixodes persulcatus]
MFSPIVEVTIFQDGDVLLKCTVREPVASDIFRALAQFSRSFAIFPSGLDLSAQDLLPFITHLYPPWFRWSYPRFHLLRLLGFYSTNRHLRWSRAFLIFRVSLRT